MQVSRFFDPLSAPRWLLWRVFSSQVGGDPQEGIMAGKKAVGPKFESDDAVELWSETMAAYSLAAHEKLILKGACTALDKIAAIQDELDGAELMSTGSMGQDVANPMLGELRQTQAAFDRAMKQLALPDPDESAKGSGGSRSSSAREAANARWGT